MLPRGDCGELQVAGRPVSWRLDGPRQGQPVVVVAHGAGAPYTSEFMESLALELKARELTVVRFHFPYMEEQVREKVRRPPDPKGVLLSTWEAVLDEVVGWAPKRPVVVAGKSMGGRMASMLLAEGRAPAVDGAVYFGYPLHPAGKPERLRSAHLPKVSVTQLFISGTRDPLCNLDLLRPIVGSLPQAELYVVEGGDHSLARGRRAPVGDSTAWIDHAAAFVHARGGSQ